MDPHTWDDAAVAYADWVGTAALEIKFTNDRRSMYEVTGIDPEDWQIIGLELGGTASSEDTHVIAVRKSDLGDGHISDVSDIKAAKILVHDVDPFDLLREIKNQLDIRLRSSATKDATVTITELLDHPPQD